MFALNVFFGLLAAATVSSSPIAEDAALANRQTQWTCPNIGNSVWTLKPLIEAPDAKNSRCCVTGWSYVHGEGREICCRNDPALLEDPTYKYALPCTSEWWTTGVKIALVRSCNLWDPANSRCRADCDGVPWLYPTPKPCPAKN
ncbi:hypothetical protein CFE70_010663 [Pyrenophora teres f. teres 0-1]|uniref:Uncharacterized protein n=2 Tax=Pyrenophora teres f. teres TaxID=97479 RepID=E3RCZ2_PYRTT|nr:hypothetical protein PTT_01287 [Pyrenophora teres f. teres 0-1]KAE8827122.1 hypothetical protein HRS9139_08294 [Pyrenophora teres f. teres]KAE8832641.1 hypothetical protein PTNB85_07033 [Pyrenophora teres f. teres]KAE8836753.1 hypothetical protein HRS9122_06908 [Pyrenophora teres f. teres]KAE8856302.1 hypothetical protein PTNB29_09141 [Pyrenophora teres f. teres]